MKAGRRKDSFAAHGLEDMEFQELLTESVGPVHFPDLSCLFGNI